MLKTGQGIVKIMERISPCLVQFLYVPVKKGLITDEWLKVNTPGYLPGLHDGKSTQEQGYLPGDKYDAGKEGKRVNNPTQELLIDIFKFPISSITQRYERLKVNPKYGNYYKKLLISEGLVRPKVIITRGYRIILFELLPKGISLLRDLGYDVKEESEGVEHKFWKSNIAEYYKTRGFNVLIEEHINGKPDIIVVNGSKQIAIEIETGSSDFIKNITRDLKAFDEMICVAEI